MNLGRYTMFGLPDPNDVMHVVARQERVYCFYQRSGILPLGDSGLWQLQSRTHVTVVMPGVQDYGEKSPAPMAVAAVESLADGATQWVLDEITRRYADLLAMRGAKGRLHTRQDLCYHLEFLSGALATGVPMFFTDYVRWLAALLQSRGVPKQTVDDSLELLQRFFGENTDPSVNAAITDVLERGRQALLDVAPADRPFYNAYRPSDLPQVAEFTRSLIDGDVRSARSLMQTTWQSLGDYVEIATRLFQPALYDVGRLWERNQITVAREHLATAISQTLLTQLFLTAELVAKPAEKIALFAAVEGNQHHMGLRIVSDAFELAGWVALFLGANTPTDALVDQVDRVRPDVLGLSASMVQHLPPLQRAVHTLKAELGTRCPDILIGGLATNQHNEVWRWIGADAWAPDAKRAVMEMT
jgi:MerR family transcriptional regulator, light-induced transcriptional regulator